ncbi:MAG TPA: metallophosphoesterase [Verrucomicrobiae bacterium]|nr:metallophosphoesterase [Verrucomicrobiae bacterium]
MRLVQISDLHIGGLFKQDTFDTMVNEINNDFKPEIIIVSGDLTDDGLVFQFEQAQTELKKLKCENLIIFPGNHDYRHTGYLLFRKYFPNTGSDGPKVYEFKKW